MHKFDPAGAPRPQKLRSAQQLGTTHRKLAEADKLRQSGKPKQAIAICEALLNDHPDYVGALHTLGLIHIERDSYWQALSCFVRAAMLNPNDWTILINLANVYLGLGAEEMAARTLEQTMKLKTDDANIPATLGRIYENQREYELAAECFRQTLELDPQYKGAANMLGSCLTHLGRVEEAADALTKAWKRDPTQMSLLVTLSQLPAPVVKIDLPSAIKKSSKTLKDNDPMTLARVQFAKAWSFDKQGNHMAAWDALLEANAEPARRAVEHHEQNVRYRVQAREIAHKYKPQKPKGISAYRDAPISLYILGPSRAGKTTLERLAAEIDGVKRGYENSILERSVRRTSQLSGLLTLDTLVNLPLELDQRLGEIYLDELMDRASGAAAFTNTHPGRIHDVGRLASAIPRTRFVFVKRDRDDIALRTFMKHYSANTNPYAYTVKNIYDHIDWYYEMIDAWLEKLPDTAICIDYADIQTDPQAQVARIAELCGLAPPVSPLPTVGDDRNCAVPYLEFLAAARAE